MTFEDTDAEVTRQIGDAESGPPILIAAAASSPISASAWATRTIDPDVDLVQDEDDSGFAYQALAGVAIGLTERLDLDGSAIAISC